MDLEKELQQLKARIEALESSSKNNLFGSSYNSVGSSSSDYLIKTRGKIKIQIGNKFIDLLKDGKLNVDSGFIFEGEAGSKDGIYVSGKGEDAKVTVSIGGQQIDLTNSAGNSYVSFLEEQSTTFDQKYTALKNIGFIYQNLTEASDVKSGIVYVESDKKLYIVENGSLQEYTLEIPSPYTEQFIVAKNDQKVGAIVIQGEGKQNSLAFNSLYIYNQGYESFIDSNEDINILIDGDTKLVINNSFAKYSTPVVSNTFQSIGADAYTGFRLYYSGYSSTLEVDNLIVRNGCVIGSESSEGSTVIGTPSDGSGGSTNESSYSSNSGEDMLYSEYWYKTNDVVSTISQYTDETIKETDYYYTITLKYSAGFQLNDILRVYLDQTETKEYTFINDEGNEETDEYSIDIQKYISFTVKKIERNQILVQTDTSNIPQLETIEEDYISNIPGKIIFLVKRNNTNIPKRDSNGFSIIDGDTTSVIVGTLDVTNKQSQNQNIVGTGIYSEQQFAKKAAYTDDYNLDESDNSTNFASTEWVWKHMDVSINDFIPKGTIMMFHGEATDIPKGWAICNGENGTPNLIDKFIKASTTSGETGGQSSITIDVENLPSHTHSLTSSKTLTTSSNGAHTHTFRGKYGKSDNADDRDCIETGSTTDSITTSSNGAHTHTIDLSSMTLGNTGEGKAIDWEPVFYSLIFIMKIQ